MLKFSQLSTVWSVTQNEDLTWKNFEVKLYWKPPAYIANI